MVRGGCRGLQGLKVVTRGYRRLMGLQGVTEVTRG